MEPFNLRLKRFRQAAELSQRAVARGIGVPESTYREWEYGRAIKGSEHYPRIAKALRISLEDLFGVSKIGGESTSELLDRVLRDVVKVKRLISEPKTK